MNRVFISYSRRNKHFAERLARDLSDAGLDVWIDFRQIHGGEMWQNEIFRGIERSEILIACLSPDAVESEWVQREINTAREQEKFIIPIMVVNAIPKLATTDPLKWMLDVQYVDFQERYEEAFPQLLSALPGKRRVSAFDTFDPENIPNPFKGLEAFQQTDATFFFGREDLIRKALKAIEHEDASRFLAVIGASGSGKSSLVRAGVIPKLRQGAVQDSEKWRMVIFTPGGDPVDALATRLAPLVGPNRDSDAIETALKTSPEILNQITEEILEEAPEEAQLLLMIDQFEEVFTRASEEKADMFIEMLHHAVTVRGGRTQALITMRADFFDRLGRYAEIAELFEQENMVIVTEMSTANLLRTIEGPAQAVGLMYEEGLAARILEDVRRQPGSLPLLQYALKALYEKRNGRMLTNAAYNEIGGVDRALARHAEQIYSGLNEDQQALMKRMLMRLVEISPEGEATRRRIQRDELNFEGVSRKEVQSLIDLMVAPESRLLIASREITTRDATSAPVTRLEISHEALIREWERYQEWIVENIENLRYSTELLKAASDWLDSGRDPAYLLRGTRLLNAEEWLEAADPNALQREFIEVSSKEQRLREEEARKQAERELALQKQSTQRLRAFVGVLIVALIIAGGLTLFAFAERQRAEENATRAAANAELAQENARQAEENAARAEENAQRAEENAAQALSFALATNAERALSNDDGDLALALAVESVITVDNVPPESRLSMANVAFAPGTRRRFTGSNSIINAVAYAPDGQTVASGEDTGRITIWDIDTGDVVMSFIDDTIRTGRSVNSMVYLPDGSVLITGMQNGTLLKWDLETGEVTQRLTAHERVVNAIAINANGTRLASASNDGSIVIWDVASGEVISRLTGIEDSVLGVVFDPTNSERLYAISRSDVFVWNLDDGSILQQVSSGTSTLTLAISGDGQYLLVGGTEGTVQLWSITGDGTVELAHAFAGHNEDAQIRAVALSDDGTLAASGSSDESIIIWDTQSRTVALSFNGHERDITSLAFNANSSRLLSGSRDRTMRLWDVKSSAIVRDFVGHSESAIGRFMPNGQALLSGSFDGTLRVWDIATGRSFQELRGHEEAVQTVAVNSDGSQALSGSTDMTIRIWDIFTGESVVLEGHTSAVSAVQYVDDERFISAGRDGAIYLWQIGESIPILDYTNVAIEQTASPSAQYALDISADATRDGTRFVSGGDDQTVTLWDVETGEIIQVFAGLNRPIRAVAMSPDGQFVAAGSTSGDIMLWQVGVDDPIHTFSGHSRAVQSVEFSPDGNSILSSAFDSSIRVWDIESGFEVRLYELNDPLLRIQNVTFSASGDRVLSGLSNGSLRLWRLYPTIESLLAWTLRNRYVPLLTCAQRTQFRIEPACGEDGEPLERELPELPELPPSPETLLTLSEGIEAVVNIAGDATLRLRDVPSLNDDTTIIQLLPDGTTLTLLDGDVRSEGFTWWQLRTAGGSVGWAVEAIDDDEDSNGGAVQTLVPISAFE